MKKLVTSVIIMMLFLIIGTSAYAERFSSIGMNIDLPKEYYDLKSAIDNNDAKIDFYTAMMQTTKEKLSEEYLLNSVLYNGINSNLANEIFLTCLESQISKSVFHLHLADENKKEQIKADLKTIAEAQGREVKSQEIYAKNGIEYVYTIMTKSKMTVYQYYTIVNGQEITLSLHSSDSSVKEDSLKKVVDSISFDELLEKPTDLASYILIGVTVILIGMVLVLMYMAFFSKKNERE